MVRRAVAADVAAVVAFVHAMPAAAQWPRNAYGDYLRESSNESAQLKALFVASAVEGAPGIRVAEQSEIAGFAAFSAIGQASGGECELENMAVAEAWRRRGIASRLLVAGELWGRTQLVGSLWLEARESNSAALALYERAGFIVVGHRSGYYTRPDEDALQMRKDFGRS